MVCSRDMVVIVPTDSWWALFSFTRAPNSSGCYFGVDGKTFYPCFPRERTGSPIEFNPCAGAPKPDFTGTAAPQPSPHAGNKSYKAVPGVCLRQKYL